MKYSLNWLQEHLLNPLPDITTLSREVTLRAFEVEEIEKTDTDYLMEIKVLPDRAHDALSHRGMAREMGALLGIPPHPQCQVRDLTLGALFGTPPLVHDVDELLRDASILPIRVSVADTTLCPRYIATRIDNISVQPSASAIASKLVRIGGRSINNIVDITNVVLFDIGQPLHAFDAMKVVGGITVRTATTGETMTTLDNKDLVLVGGELVIADDDGVLALAGIKGGKKAEVTSSTTSIILESANFEPTLTRKTSQKHGIKTDASKRYENGLSSTLASEATHHALALIKQYCPDATIAESVDVYPKPEEVFVLTITTLSVNTLLGLTLSDDDMARVLTRAQFTFEKSDVGFVVRIPPLRLDLRITEDMIEEIGRHVGYEQITSVMPTIATKGIPNTRLYYANKVRTCLIEKGYSEVYTYSFAKPKEGEIEVMHPVGKDRPFIRHALTTGITKSLESNLYWSALLATDAVKIFELGNVFPVSGEHTALALGVITSNKKQFARMKDENVATYHDVVAMLGLSKQDMVMQTPDIIEIDFDALIKDLPEPSAYERILGEAKSMKYESLSAYPFIVRDIAIFVPEVVTEAFIEDKLTREAGDLLVRFSRFDKFQKEGESRISYGFRMVFQSFERTLTDEEVGAIMERITISCNSEKDWSVR